MKLGELASKLGLEHRGDADLEITAPAPIEAAGPGTITFVAGPKYLAALRATQASCVILPIKLAAEAPCATLVSLNPYVDFARVLEIFFPTYRPGIGIDPTASISEEARIAPDASIGAFCAIGASAVIGRRAVIHPHVTIYPGVRIGDDFVCHSHASIRENVIIGNRVTILNGAVIGADGFGFVEHEGRLVKVPQVGSVTIEDDVEIGANSTVDRATIGATMIRRGAKLDDQVHIGHNCDIGEYSRFAGHTGLAGSVTVGRWCQFGGQSGCADHVKIGDRVRVVAQAGIHNELADDALVAGTPAIDARTFRRMVAVEPRLPELLRRIRALEEHAGIAAKREEE